MTLHGIYDHGKIELQDQDLPQVRAEVEITLKDDAPAPETGPRRKRDLQFNAFRIDTRGWKFNRDEANER